MQKRRPVFTATVVTVAVLVGPVVGVAAADGAVLLGGGAGVTVNGTPCILTTIGHDRAGDLVGFTAATCGGPGSVVAGVGHGRTFTDFVIPGQTSHIGFTLTSAVLNDLNAKGVPGNGFSPIPA